MKFVCRFRIFFCLLSLFLFSIAALNDYWGHFCGKKNCYDLLGVSSLAEKGEIKKAYRALSLEYHPDKNPSEEAQKIFQEIAKANEVLTNDEQRQKYDYYREHPDEYWEEYGHYFFMSAAAATDIRLVVLGILIFISIFQPIIQNNKYNQAKSFLVKAATKGWNVKQGGTKATIELRRQAEEILAERQKSPKTTSKKDSKKVKKKGYTTEELEEIIKELVEDVKIEGGYSKPTVWDIPIVKVGMLPVSLFRFGQYHYRYSYLKMELPYEEKERLAISRMGFFWDELSEEEREELIEREIWKYRIFEDWKQQKEEEMKEKRPGMYKRTKRYLKKEGGGGQQSSKKSPSTPSTKKTLRKQVGSDEPISKKNVTESPKTAHIAPVVVNGVKPSEPKSGDSWSQEQQSALEAGLKKFPATLDKNERWKGITSMVEGKTMQDCIKRYKSIKSSVQSKEKS